MTYSMKFNVWLEWTDGRIQFQNLNDESHLNKISDEVAMNIWIPKPVFQNNKNRAAIKYEPSSSVIMLIKNGTSGASPLLQMDEAKVFKSEETKLRMRTIHFLDFQCDFNLQYFPFDHQTCFVEVISKSICNYTITITLKTFKL